MAYDFSSLKKRTGEVVQWLKDEYTGIRTGRATPTLLDRVLVEAYGGKLPVSQVGSISVEDARTLRVSPWDATLVKAIEKAIITADLGLSVATDEKGCRVSFPELTSERRGMLVKLLKEKLEEGRVSLRKSRDEVWNDIQKKEKEGTMSEDEKFRYKDEMQKIIDGAGNNLEETAARKEKEIAS